MALTKIPASLLDTSGGVPLGDSERLNIGSDSDLALFHTGSNGVIHNTTGSLRIRANTLNIQDYSNEDAMITANSNGSVELYHNNLKKFETSSTGATVTGNLAVTGDLDITGNVNSASVTDLDVTDKTITLGAGQTEALSGGSGIIIDGSSASLLWNESATTWDFNNALGIASPLDASLTLNKTSSSAWNYIQIAQQGTRNFYLGSDTTSNFVFGADNSGDFYFTGGKVGINESSHDAYLHVTGKSSYTTANSSEVSGLGFVRLQPNSNSEHSLWFHNANNNLGISGYTDAATTTSRDITLQTYGGNVGIGTDSPNSTLTLRGNEIGGQTLTHLHLNSGNNTTSYPFLASVNSNNVANSTYGWLFINSSDNGNLEIFRKNNNTTPDIVMAMSRNNGNVGIGTDNPDELLHLRHTGGKAVLKFTRDDTTTTAGSSVGTIQFAHTDADNAGVAATIVGKATNAFGKVALLFATGNPTTKTERMRLDAEGNLGIGTDSPEYALDVYDDGEAWIRADSSTSTESTANSGLRFAHAGVNHGVLYHRGSDDYLVYYDNISGNTRFEVTNNGSFVLHDGVAHNANAPTHRGSLILAGASGFQNFGGIEFHTSSGGGAGYGTRIVSSDASMLFGRRFNATGWSESMRINNDGWVGIGGINPTSLLDVNGIISIKANDVIDSDGTSHYFKTPAGGAMYFYHGSTNVMYVSSAGLLPGTDNARDLGSTSNRWRNLYTTDLHLSNEGKPEGNEVDGTTGNWTIQEGEEHLYIINNKSGKKYRFALEEIE